MPHWIYMTLEASGFVALSAALWLVIKRADPEPATTAVTRPAWAEGAARQQAPVSDADHFRTETLEIRGQLVR